MSQSVGPIDLALPGLLLPDSSPSPFSKQTSHLPGLDSCWPFPVPQDPLLPAPLPQPNLYRRAGQTGSPGWQSPARGDRGWQTPGSQALGKPCTQLPTRPRWSSSKRPSGTCQAGGPHSSPRQTAGNTAPASRLHRGTVHWVGPCHTVAGLSLSTTRLRLSPTQSDGQEEPEGVTSKC
jgi:hypothetical protein